MSAPVRAVDPSVSAPAEPRPVDTRVTGAPGRGQRADGWLRSHGLVLVLSAMFMLFLTGQILAGQRVYNEEQVEHGEGAVSLTTYLTTAHFGEAVLENWESEFLQMGAYVVLTVWLFQRGSSESKPLDDDDPVNEHPEDHADDPDAPWPVRQGGVALWVYRRSLSIAFFTLFVLSWLAHAATGAREYSAEQISHGSEPVTVWEYLHRSQFWFESMQNWQSEFLAVASIVFLSIYLRQQGSPESKPVHAPHRQTGSD
jgi:hypothetical protein